MVVAGGVKRWLTGVARSGKEVARPGRSGSQGRGQSSGSGARPVIGLRGGDVGMEERRQHHGGDGRKLKGARDGRGGEGREKIKALIFKPT
jgi:hypothetical protein